jgi:hypothetical protein
LLLLNDVGAVFGWYSGAFGAGKLA